MKIWYDACTGKHMRYGSAISQRLRKKGHKIIFTTRKHPDTIHLARILGEKPVIVGEYKPSSLADRLEENSNTRRELSSSLSAKLEVLYSPTITGFSPSICARGIVSGCLLVVKIILCPFFRSRLLIAEPYRICLPVHASYHILMMSP